VRLVKNNAWSESTTTWRNRPCCNHNIAGIVNDAKGDAWCDIDVSTVVRGEGIYTFAVGGELTMPSKEKDAAKAARLLIEEITPATE